MYCKLKLNKVIDQFKIEIVIILYESEFKYNSRNKTHNEILNEFFDCYNLIYDFFNYRIEKDPEFLYK
jgi:hypothetical protein